MKAQTPAWWVGGLALLVSASGAVGQGSFQNLDFESATIVPVSGGPFVDFSQAFPGWTGYLGGVQESLASYDSVPMSTAGFSILDRSYSGPIGVIDGSFTAFLQSGAGNVGQEPDATLAQTGLVPAGTESLLFKAYLGSGQDYFQVTLGGQALSLVPVQAGSNYTLYAADIHGWAGQTAELAFTALYPHPHIGEIPVYLDSMQFSDQGVPEPGVCNLSALGAVLLGWRVLRRRR